MARSTSAPRAKSTRTETDSFGPIEVAADRYWGAQTERSRQNFRSGKDRMPIAIIHALKQVLRNLFINAEHAGVDDRHVEADLDRVVEENGVDRLAYRVVTAKGE